MLLNCERIEIGGKKYKNEFIFTISLHSPYCICGYAKETGENFILECPNYKLQRKELRKRMGVWKMRINKPSQVSQYCVNKRYIFNERLHSAHHGL